MSALEAGEHAITFAVDGTECQGILHAPSQSPRALGVVIVVGGPQYRAGSHRHFVLLARRLASEGYPVMRFDYRGMGDSEGSPVGFEGCLPDIRAAIDELFRLQPTVKKVALWGLCDGASAAFMYAPSDTRVAALIGLNPWVRSTASLAQTQLRHHYFKRLLDPEFWRTTMLSPRRVVRSITGFARDVGTAASGMTSGSRAPADFRERMRQGLAAFHGPLLLLISGNDMTAAEFNDAVESQPQWRKALGRCEVTVHRLPDADHTLSRRSDQELADSTLVQWLGQQVRQ